MPERYTQTIIKYLSGREYQPLKPRQLARRIGVKDEDYGTFREAVKRLRDAGRVVMGASDSLVLPEISRVIIGVFRPNPRGFGFLVPETPNSNGDLFIPPGSSGGALNGDKVRAKVRRRGQRGGKHAYGGEIVEILQRGQNRQVGALRKADGTWFILPDGSKTIGSVVIRDVPSSSKEGTKVVVEITSYGDEPGDLPVGVIVETLGEETELLTETLAVIRSHSLSEIYPDNAQDDARKASEQFDPNSPTNREDLTKRTIITIDPDTAKDFDDAISLTINADGTRELGVHIADVSHFVTAGAALDDEARKRATSVYLVKKVIPMLPEILSNGVCSLQEGQKRFCKSVFIKYDSDAEILGYRFAETIIKSTKRLTYAQAQSICDGKTGEFDPAISELVKSLETIARQIEIRRRKKGMLHLDLPDVELILGENDKIVDAVPTDTSYSHTIIEMFMVEANDAAATVLDQQDIAFLRRIHPEPDSAASSQLGAFTKVCGHRLPRKLTRKTLQELLESVKGHDESYAVNLAVLRTFQQAEYSPLPVGHFALASEHYCHFTSPIRRYPDLTIHRLLGAYINGKLPKGSGDLAELTQLGESCTAAEKTAQAAERELREVLVLQFLSGKVGETFEGIITGVTNFGMFVQSPQFLVEGLIRISELGDDWWEVSAKDGMIRGEVSGKKYRIGDRVGVKIAGVEVAIRQLNLVLDRKETTRGKKKNSRKKAHKKTKSPRKQRRKRN